MALSGRLTFSNTRGRLPVEFIDYVLPVRAPETLSSLSKSRISLFNAHLALLSQLRSQNPNGKYHHLVN